MPKIGLVLSGGGVRSFAHLGLLQVLDELGIHLYAISGVSSGAIVGALYAAGQKPEEILSLMKGNMYFSWSNFRLNKDGFFSMQPLLDSLKKIIPEDSFESLPIRLFVTVTDFTKNKPFTFSEGRLFETILASSSVPVIFEPVKMGDSLLVDGGLLNNFPVEPLENICDKLIGSHVNNIQNQKEPFKHIGKALILERCFHMAIANTIYKKTESCRVFIEPLLDQFGMFERNKADMIYEIGYKTALKYKAELIKLQS